MQRVTVLCVGKLKEKFYLEAAAEYVKRLQRFCKLELVELPESRLPESPPRRRYSGRWRRRRWPSGKGSPRAGQSSPCASRESPVPAWS